MHCMDCTIQTFLLELTSSKLVATLMIKLMGLYKYASYLV